MWEVAEGNLGTAGEARLLVSKQTGQGRGKSGKDLEVGTVDELLVGEYVVRARDKEEKTLRWLLPWLLGSPLIL